ncbi:DUF397 domain-containing protein [Streptomyces sp. SID9913]|uniref:DUF397 domain-containing protein n=2 Tax=unclassified Streptomyces TaxID=2593676 RepID=A0A6G3R010_9ACTN|nr:MULTISPECIES: DUF397 domain-containing protein [unclassified Streptomyces]NEA89036.1 DUF397 domain-containing protein [Streptomyces sp. SID14436]NEC82442.1 DUF397 domain-containing protein [Streptomyces sp. SID7958]NED16607.1 DUF397 domain-containing protein [Streptomyces sp. SID9913]
MTHRPSADGSALEWFKSSYSTNDGPECVEIATTPTTVHVRDSKHIPGPHLTFSPTQWAAFLPYARGDR